MQLTNWGGIHVDQFPTKLRSYRDPDTVNHNEPKVRIKQIPSTAIPSLMSMNDIF